MSQTVITPGVITYLILALAVAAAVSFLLTPVAMRVARAVGAIDEPDSARRVHRLPVARLGGLAVGTTFVVVGVIAVTIGRQQFPSAMPTPGPGPSRFVDDKELLALFAGALLALGFGYIDDRWQIRARYQFLGQLLLAVVALAGGIVFTQIANPLQILGSAFGNANLVFGGAGWFALEVAGVRIEVVPAVLTTLWIVGMINSINWIDGLDGLSTGVSLIAAVTLCIISIASAPVEPTVGLLCAVLAGSLAGFLPWNFHPARVFIGTGGVMAVGYALAVLSILGTAKVAVALLILGVPIIDTFWIIIRRVANGSSPFEPDRGHLHHRLLDLGLSHRGAVLLIYAMCVALGVAGIVLSSSGAAPLYAFLGVVLAGGLVLYLVTRRTSDSLDASSYPDDASGPPASRPPDAGPTNTNQATATPGHGTRPVR
jgi:UDP-GlcNAc:undecaprenyl-phosphate GlcNAc-1-phosphate transferase